jgi:fibronectin-binding autotransporter adhesin
MTAVLAASSYAQTTQTWRTEASSGSWQGSTNWWNFPNGSPIVFGQQQWDNNHFLSQTNQNGGSAFSTYRWLFQSGASSVHTFAGDAVRFFDFGGSDPQIINQSAATHVVNLNIEGDGTTDDPLQVRIDNSGGGGLTFGGTINNQGSRLEVLGSAASAATVTFGGVISGSGGFYKENANITVVMTNANTYSGQTEVQNGTLRLAGSGSLANSAVRLHSGGTLSVSNSATVSSVAEFGSGNAGVIAISNGATLTVTANSLDVFQNSISGAGGLTKQGSHSLSLYGSQTYTGNTTVSAGQLATSVAMSSTNFSLTGGTFRTTAANVISDTAGMTLSGGTISLGGAETFGNSGVTLSNSTSSTISVDSGVAATLGGTLSGGGNITKSGAGTLVLSGSNTYSAGTRIEGGIIQIGNNSALGTGTITNAGAGAGLATDATSRTLANALFLGANTVIGGTGVLQIDGTTTLLVSRELTNNNAGGLILSNLTLGNDSVNRTLELRGTGATTINGLIAGGATNVGSLDIFASGNTTLNGANTYGGSTTVRSTAFVILGNNSSLGNTNGGTTVSSGGTLDVNGRAVSGEALTLGGFGAGSIGALRNAGTGSAVWTGLITLNTSTVGIGATNNSSLVVSNISGGANELWVVGAGTTIIAGGATNSGSGTAFVKTNTGTAILMASNAWSGAEFIREGVVVLSNNNALGTGGATTLGATAGSAAATLTLGSGITNSNSITVEAGGTGTRTLGYQTASGTGAQLGSIALNNSSLAINVTNGGTLLFGGGLTAGAGGSDVNRLALDGGGTLIVTNNGTGIAATDRYQVRVGNGTLIIGAGTIVARTNVTGLGHAIDLGVDLTNGIVNATSALRASNGITVSNSIFASSTNSQARILGASGANAAVTFSGPVGLAGAALTLDATNDQTITVSGSITNFSGTGSLIKAGGGLAILTAANTYSGGTTLSNGVLRVANASGLGTGSLSQVSGASTLQFSNAGTVTNNMSVYNVAFISGNNTLSGSQTLNNTTYEVASGTTNTLSGNLSGSGGVTKTGGGDLVIAGTTNNTFTGDTDVQGGRLVLDKSDGITAISSTNATGGLRIATGAVVELASNNQINNTTGLDLDGGTFLTGTSTAGYAETLGTLTLSSSSTIDFGSWAGGSGSRNLNFADSSSISWTGSLIITNWTQATNSDSGQYGRLYFGNSTNGLTSAQRGDIFFHIGVDVFGAKILSDGEVVADITPIPEPRVYAAALVLLAAVGWRERKRLRRLLAGSPSV